MTTILYLHGFISSPASRKAVMLGDYLRGQAPDVEYLVPALHHRPAQAIPLYEFFVQQLQAMSGRPVLTGEFGADMKVSLVNDGPVTLTMDSKNLY